jgi:hypothetical protein
MLLVRWSSLLWTASYAGAFLSRLQATVEHSSQDCKLRWSSPLWTASYTGTVLSGLRATGTLEQSTPNCKIQWSIPLQTASYTGPVLSGLRATLEQASWDSELKTPQRKWQSGKELLWGFRSTLEQTALREILLLRGILEKLTRIGVIFKKFIVKRTFKLKINIIWNPLNFKSFQ